jgi:CDP-diacylglycerol--glycerol-3-phosphate 3-phosphatidyltransferase
VALNAYARTATDRVVVPIARELVRMGATPNWLTTFGLALTVAGAAIVLSGQHFWGGWVLAFGVLTDAFDGAVARLRGSESPIGSFYDSVADRVSDAVLFSTAAWLIRDSPVLFGVAMVALAAALITSYMRAKAESLGWKAAVGVIERPERVIIIIPGIALDLLPIALTALAVGGVVTVAQRGRAVLQQAGRT